MKNWNRGVVLFDNLDRAKNLAFHSPSYAFFLFVKRVYVIIFNLLLICCNRKPQAFLIRSKFSFLCPQTDWQTAGLPKPLLCPLLRDLRLCDRSTPLAARLAHEHDLSWAHLLASDYVGNNTCSYCVHAWSHLPLIGSLTSIVFEWKTFRLWTFFGERGNRC